MVSDSRPLWLPGAAGFFGAAMKTTPVVACRSAMKTWPTSICAFGRSAAPAAEISSVLGAVHPEKPAGRSQAAGWARGGGRGGGQDDRKGRQAGFDGHRASPAD